MPAYIVVTIDVKDPVTYEMYKKAAPGSIAAYGGRYIARGGSLHTLEGTWAPRRLVILEFPSMEKAKAWWSSPEYREARDLRQSCADAEMVVVEGV